MDQYIGKLLDNRYEILEVVGSGGMAKVYKARCHRLNRLVAIKILREDLSQDAEFRRRFHDESQAVAMLSHPNIVAVYDVSRSSCLLYTTGAADEEDSGGLLGGRGSQKKKKIQRCRCHGRLDVSRGDSEIRKSVR